MLNDGVSKNRYYSYPEMHNNDDMTKMSKQRSLWIFGHFCPIIVE